MESTVPPQATPLQPAHLEVSAGHVIAHCLFDVADAIDLVLAEQLWASRTGHRGHRTRLSSASDHELKFEAPPVLISLPAQVVRVGGADLRAEMSARLYDFGAIALALRLDASALSWPDFARRCHAFDLAVGPGADSAHWPDALKHVLAAIGPALRRPATRHLEEDYLVAVVRQFGQPMTADAVREQVDVASLLAGEFRPLSNQERKEIMRQSFSYLADDLVVLAWNCAFVLEPRGDSDVTDIIEFANAQLLEMRYYDDLLDDELSTMYELIEGARGGLSFLASRRAARLASRLHGLVAEITRLTERVENSLKVTEDVYLARIYSACLDLFRVPRLSLAVSRKLAIIRDTYGVMYEEAANRRAEILELAIALLIVLEIILAFAR